MGSKMVVSLNLKWSFLKHSILTVVKLSRHKWLLNGLKHPMSARKKIILIHIFCNISTLLFIGVLAHILPPQCRGHLITFCNIKQHLGIPEVCTWIRRAPNSAGIKGRPWKAMPFPDVLYIQSCGNKQTVGKTYGKFVAMMKK